jgi:hypothetical protein
MVRSLLPIVISTSSNLHRVDVIFSGFKVSGIKVKHIIILAIKAKFIYICATRNRKNYISIFVKILVVVDGQVALANNEGDDFVIGTLSATDPDTDTTTNALTFTIDNSPDFEIVNGRAVTSTE